jgi:catechol 2,3-dioxygenase-like lactoylglutathione lyase family enzyme
MIESFATLLLPPNSGDAMYATTFGQAADKPSFRHCARGVAWTIALVALTAGVPTKLAAAEFRGVRLNVSDPQAAAQWYCKHLGGTLAANGPEASFGSDRGGLAIRTVQFGKTTLEFVPAPISPAGRTVPGSVGSGLDHLGFGYADLDPAMKRFAETGVEIVSGIEREGPIRYAFIKDRWGTLIELVEDREIHGFHHVHLATTDPKATLKWYTDVFGGRVTRFAGLLPGIRYGDVWVLVKTVKRPLAPTEGRSIDRLIWVESDARGALDRFGARRIPPTVGQVAGGSKHILISGPDRVQLAITAPDR